MTKKRVVDAVEHSFQLDNFSRVIATSHADGGSIESQSVQALLLLAILVELQKMNEPEAM